MSSTASKRSPKKLLNETSTSPLLDTDYFSSGELRVDGPYENVWDAIEDDLGERERMKMLSYLMMIVRSHIKLEGWTQKQAAAQMGATQPRISDLMRGKIDLFSVDSLVMMAGKAGLHLTIGLKPPKA